MDNRIKVKLTRGLTKYAKGLVAGTEGITVGAQGIWSRGSDRFITVNFPGIAQLDVLWDSLEITDEAVLQERVKQAQRLAENLKTAQHVVLTLGPKGGFRALSYSYVDRETGAQIHTSTGFRAEAHRYIEIFRSHHIPIKEVIQK